MKIPCLLFAFTLLVVTGCRTVPKATPEEIAIRDKWAAMVPMASRRQIFDEADRHTDWGEKRKIRFEVEQFERIVHGSGEHKGHTTRPTTTTKPA